MKTSTNITCASNNQKTVDCDKENSTKILEKGGSNINTTSVATNNQINSLQYSSPYNLNSNQEYGSYLNNSSYFPSNYSNFLGAGYGGNFNSFNNCGMYGQNQIPGQQPSFRNEYQGVINGLGSIINLSYASIGFIAYGKQLISTSAKIIMFLLRGTKNVFVNAISFSYVKRLLLWLKDSNINSKIVNQLQKGGGKLTKLQFFKQIFGKILSVIRVLALLFILSSYLMQTKLKKTLNHLLQSKSINALLNNNDANSPNKTNIDLQEQVQIDLDDQDRVSMKNEEEENAESDAEKKSNQSKQIKEDEDEDEEKQKQEINEEDIATKDIQLNQNERDNQQSTQFQDNSSNQQNPLNQVKQQEFWNYGVDSNQLQQQVGNQNIDQLSMTKEEQELFSKVLSMDIETKQQQQQQVQGQIQQESTNLKEIPQQQVQHKPQYQQSEQLEPQQQQNTEQQLQLQFQQQQQSQTQSLQQQVSQQEQQQYQLSQEINSALPVQYNFEQKISSLDRQKPWVVLKKSLSSQQ